MSAMEDGDFGKVCQQYLKYATKEVEIRHAMKDVSSKRKELEETIKNHMEKNNIVDLPFSGFDIKTRESVKKKAPKKDQVIDGISRKFGMSADEIARVYEDLKTDSKVRQVRAIRKPS